MRLPLIDVTASVLAIAGAGGLVAAALAFDAAEDARGLYFAAFAAAAMTASLKVVRSR